LNNQFLVALENGAFANPFQVRYAVLKMFVGKVCAVKNELVWRVGRKAVTPYKLFGGSGCQLLCSFLRVFHAILLDAAQQFIPPDSYRCR